MKITFILRAHSITGGYRAIFELSNRLKNRGHEVFLIYPLIPLNIEPEFKIKNLIKKIRGTLGNLKRERGINWFNIKAEIIRTLTLSPKFIRYIERKIPDSDVVVATAWETAYVVDKLSGKKGIKAYFVQHYEIWDLWDDDVYWKEAEKIARNEKELFMAMANIVPNNPLVRKFKELVDNTYGFPFVNITTAHWLKKFLEGKYGKKAKRIALGVNFNDFHSKNIKRNETKTILMPIRKTKWKGYDDGVQALKLVKEKFPGVRIILYGVKNDDGISDLLEAHNAKLVYGNELRELYCSSDIFVFPSRVEGWGLPPMEAMACGTACVTTDVGGVSDYTIPGKTAIVVPPRNPEKLAEAIIDLLEDDDKRNQIAKSGHEYIKQFSWEQTANQLEMIFQKTINNTAEQKPQGITNQINKESILI